MDNKCLITKLGRNVDNPNLPVLGRIRLDGRLYSEGNYDDGLYQGRRTIITYDAVIKDTLGVVYQEDGTIISTFSNNNEIRYTYPAKTADYTKPVKIEVYHKYRITGINMITNDGKDRTIEIPDMDAIYWLPALTSIALASNQKLSGNVEKIMPNFINKANMTSVILYSTTLTGDIAEAFGDFTKLAYLTFNRCKITGTIEQLCENQQSRTSGTLVITINDSTIRPSFNSNTKSRYSITFSSDSIVVRSAGSQLGSYTKSTGEWVYDG